MSEKILVPVLGESITEATVAKWLKNQGDQVEADEPIVELETDKVNLEVPAPVDGTLSEIKFKNGSTVEVGAVLGSVSSNNSENTIIKKDNKESDEQKIKSVENLDHQKIETELFDEIDNNDNQKDEPLI